MTLVNTETGELVDALGREEAERLTTRIALKLDAMADTYVGVMPLIREVIERQAFAALGYRSVGEYVQDRFGGSLDKLGIEIRREVVRELTEAGMSTRAIAPVIGASHVTVARDLAGVTRVTPAAAPVPQVEAESPSLPDAPRPAVVGIDGKTYSRPEPIDHAARADRAVSEFPELAYYRDRGERGDLEHTWRLADKLREYDVDELPMRRSILRRSIEVDEAKREGRPVPPLTHDHQGNPLQQQPASAPAVEMCPTCGQQVRT